MFKVEKTSIYGTDVRIYNWDDWMQKTIKTPITIGHEFVGHIAEMGRVKRWIDNGDTVFWPIQK